MTIRRTLIHALDRPGGRSLLAGLTTWLASRQTGQDVSVFYDDVWLHRLGSSYIADSPAYPYFADTFTNWDLDLRSIRADADDWWFHVYKPRAGDIILDVGAGIGSDTLVFSRSVGASGKVLAIEAHPSTYRCLIKLCEWNNLANTVCSQCAVTDTRRTVYIEDSSDPQASTVGFLADSTRSQEVVRGASLDEICGEHGFGSINFLKINIEGGERFAIQGMSNVIQKTDYICFACHDFRADRGDGEHFRTRELVLDFLRSHDFRITMRRDDPRPWARDHVHGIRRGAEGRTT